MPYPAEHKPRTHARIVRAASRLFRGHGYSRTGVETLMAKAGLTRGGFYAHFRNKEQLLREALEHAFEESRENLLGRGLEALRGSEWLSAASRRYLRAAHVRSPEAGCPIPALGAEVARAPRSVRKGFEQSLLSLGEEMRARLGDRSKKRALRLLAAWTGAIILARAVADQELAQEILDAVRDE